MKLRPHEGNLRAWQVGVLWVHRDGRWGATPDLRLG